MQNIWIQTILLVECLHSNDNENGMSLTFVCRMYRVFNRILPTHYQPLSIPIPCKIATFAQINRPIQIMPDVFFPRFLPLCVCVLFSVNIIYFYFLFLLLFALFFITFQNLLSRFLSVSKFSSIKTVNVSKIHCL